jgi:hypothetical protein
MLGTTDQPTQLANFTVEETHKTKYHVPDHVGETVVIQPSHKVESSATKQDIEELKLQVNDSFAELVNLLLDLTQKLTILEERIDRYNARSSHKI